MTCDFTQTPYGSFRSRTFADIFPTASSFRDAKIDPDDQQSESLLDLFEIRDNVKPANLSMLYFMLYGRYGNSHISNLTDENQFRFELMSIIRQYGPTWDKKLELQKKIRDLDDAQIILGGEATYNHAFNPETSPGTGSRDSINFINDQNKTLYTTSKLDAYSKVLALLEDDVSKSFLDKFRHLFLAIPAPDKPLVYVYGEE